MTIHWHGGFTSQHQVVRPVGCYRQLRDYDQLISRIKTLHGEGKNVQAIAEQLNREGFVPPRRRDPFTVGALAPLLQREGLVGERRRDDLLGADEWRVRDLAARLQIPPCRIYYWISRNWLHARRTLSGQTWIAWADHDELKRLEKLKMLRNSIPPEKIPSWSYPKSEKNNNHRDLRQLTDDV